MDSSILIPWLSGHGLLLALIIGRRVLRNVAGF